MKTKLTLVAAALVALNVSAIAADSAAEKTDARVEVTYVNPEKFADVKDSSYGSERGRDAYLSELKEHLVDRGSKWLAEGHKLAVTITDVDLAGDFEPWRGAQLSDVRIIKEIYPPRVNLSFKITDATGAVVKEGTRELRDLTFQMTTMTIPSSDHLRYEKATLDNWLRSELPRVKKAKK